MKRGMILAVMLAAMLCGCAEKNDAMQEALRFRSDLVRAGGCAFSCEVTADCEGAVYEFSMDCRYEGGEGRFTLTAPSSVAGICAVVSEDGAEVSFDGTVLELGEIAGGRVAPLGAAWLFGSAWEKDYISAAGTEDGLCRVRILKGYDDDEIAVETWLSGGVPIRAETSYKGKCVLSAQFSSFSWTEAPAAA